MSLSGKSGDNSTEGRQRQEDIQSIQSKTVTCETEGGQISDKYNYLAARRIHIQCLQTQPGGAFSQRGGRRSSLNTAQTSSSPQDTLD